MDPLAATVIGFVSSVAVVVVAQFIIAARSSKEKLEAANNNAIVSKIETFDIKVSTKLDKLTEGQVAMNKEIEVVKRRLSVLRRKLERAERELEVAKKQLEERQHESIKKSKSIEILEEKIDGNSESILEIKALYKRIEQWMGRKEIEDLNISKANG